jgi:dTDP-4-dehydrorhamnose 3,5-epimerase
VRPQAPTYGRWVAVRLTAEDRRMLYVPEGMAHGFQTLTDDTEVFYQMSEPYQPDAQRGVRWNDPACAIKWPIAPVIVSARDAALPLLGG